MMDHVVVTIAQAGDRTIIHAYGSYTREHARTVKREITAHDIQEHGLDEVRKVHVSVHRLLKDDRDVELGR